VLLEEAESGELAEMTEQDWANLRRQARDLLNSRKPA
jgi:hypothetical protein